MLKNKVKQCLSLQMQQCFSFGGMKSEMWQRLREAMRRSDVKAVQIADECGKTASAVSQWLKDPKSEGRSTNPTYENLLVFSRLTGAPLEYLISDDVDVDAPWPRTDPDIVTFCQALELASDETRDKVYQLLGLTRAATKIYKLDGPLPGNNPQGTIIYGKERNYGLGHGDPSRKKKS